MGEPLWHFLAGCCLVTSLCHIARHGADAFYPLFGKYPLAGALNFLIGPLSVVLEPAAFPEEACWEKFEIRAGVGIVWLLGLLWFGQAIHGAGFGKVIGGAVFAIGYCLCSATSQYLSLTGKLDKWLDKKKPSSRRTPCCKSKRCKSKQHSKRKSVTRAPGLSRSSTPESREHNAGHTRLPPQSSNSSDETGSDVHSEKLLEQ